jgi:hypothetical protein
VHAVPGSTLAPRTRRWVAAPAGGTGGATVLLFTRALQPDPEAPAPARTFQPVAVPPALPAQATSGRTCSCGHGKQAHEHYRRGTDCAVCSCARYDRPLLRRLLSRKG